MLGVEILLGLTAAALALLYFYLTATFSHWKTRGVKFVKPYPGVGSLLPLLTVREHAALFFQRLYREHEGESFVGFFQGRVPALLIRDPELIKSLFIKDFLHFMNHGLSIDEDINPLQAKNLFNMEGQRWRDMRSKLSPTFTSGRMKVMFPVIQDVANQFESHLETLADTGVEHDIKDLLARLTTDVIGNVAFGIKCDSINDPNCKFREMGRKVFDPSFTQSIQRIFIACSPWIAKKLHFQFTARNVVYFFRGLVNDVIALRSKTGETRKDFMQLMIELKEKGRLAPEDGEKTDTTANGHFKYAPGTDSKLTEDDVTAQAMVFFFAGFETSSTSLTYALFELARQPELQRKARKQIDEVLERHNGKMSYEALQEMTYLDCIFQETLRKYPLAPSLLRRCTKNYVMPGTKVMVEEGTTILIPLYALHHDPKYFPDPERFDPERFSDEKQRHHPQFAYLPFGEGPRMCIGIRFARLQSRMGLYAVLRRFEVQPSPRTEYPLVWDRTSVRLVTKADVFLKLTKVKN